MQQNIKKDPVIVIQLRTTFLKVWVFFILIDFVTIGILRVIDST